MDHQTLRLSERDVSVRYEACVLSTLDRRPNSLTPVSENLGGRLTWIAPFDPFPVQRQPLMPDRGCGPVNAICGSVHSPHPKRCTPRRSNGQHQVSNCSSVEKFSADVIKSSGAVPQATIERSDVKPTRENLQVAIKGETYERDTMYPDFLKQARLDRNKDALKSLNFAKTSEVEHAKLYALALSHLDQLKGSKDVTFFVCPTCGYTTRDMNLTKCPSCFTPKERFEKVA